ncbi:xyloglucan:xyloglucosyl transferase [Trifolium repens]|nr:xyloglucan:xyloglucosyl transferase [Trifolium repens]
MFPQNESLNVVEKLDELRARINKEGADFAVHKLYTLMKSLEDLERKENHFLSRFDEKVILLAYVGCVAWLAIVLWEILRKAIIDGQIWYLSLDNITGCGFQTKQRYRFGWFSMKLKLVGGDSAGVVTTYYEL